MLCCICFLSKFQDSGDPGVEVSSDPSVSEPRNQSTIHYCRIESIHVELRSAQTREKPVRYVNLRCVTVSQKIKLNR